MDIAQWLPLFTFQRKIRQRHTGLLAKFQEGQAHIQIDMEHGGADFVKDGLAAMSLDHFPIFPGQPAGHFGGTDRITRAIHDRPSTPYMIKPLCLSSKSRALSPSRARFGRVRGDVI